MGATICTYCRKIKTFIKKCFNCKTNIEEKINPPYKLKVDENEIIIIKSENEIIPERKISNYVEENYMRKNNIEIKNQNQNFEVDIEELKKDCSEDCSENCSENCKLESNKKSIILSNKNIINKCENTSDNFKPKSPI
tara:strand:+ start:127 stop:540 length:414 start_codon:yes stop_codon:yes gene_type:complete